jgi:RsiW-degrading membrane proteinase PrsW (M82 family)
MTTIIFASIAPTLALLIYFYLKDEYNPEPISMIAKSFLLGMICIIPISFFQFVIHLELIKFSFLNQALFFTSIPEETLKWILFYVLIYSNKEFDEPIDGIVYAVSISLGFATIENILYLFTYGVKFALMRALFPVLSHCIFGIIMGYFYGKAKFSQNFKKLFFVLSLLIPILLHTNFDFLIISKVKWIYYLTPFMLSMWFISMYTVKRMHHKTTELHMKSILDAQEAS